MRAWYLFSGGIGVGLLLAAGFGFAWPGESPLRNPEARFPHLPSPPKVQPLGAVVNATPAVVAPVPVTFAGQPVRPDDGTLGIIALTCGGLLGGLLGFARPVETQNDRVDLGRLVGDTLETLRPQKLFRDLEITLNLPTASVTATGDADHFRQVLMGMAGDEEGTRLLSEALAGLAAELVDHEIE